MKKLFFLCAFLFISMEIQAQLYIVRTSADYTGMMGEINIYSPNETEPTIIEVPLVEGSNINDPLPEFGWPVLHSVLNDIIADGYKLIHTNSNDDSNWSFNVYYLAVPWTTVGLTEIDSSELGLRISPNPANEYINVTVDFKSQPSELVLISEGGYVYFKKDISNVMSGQEFRLDISNIPAGKYLVTVKDEKQYLTPKKLIIF